MRNRLKTLIKGVEHGNWLGGRSVTINRRDKCTALCVSLYERRLNVWWDPYHEGKDVYFDLQSDDPREAVNLIFTQYLRWQADVDEAS